MSDEVARTEETSQSLIAEPKVEGSLVSRTPSLDGTTAAPVGQAANLPIACRHAKKELPNTASLADLDSSYGNSVGQWARLLAISTQSVGPCNISSGGKRANRY